MTAIVGKFFYQFGITLCAAVLISLLEAIIITPMRTAAFLRTSSAPTKWEYKLEKIFNYLQNLYQRALQKCFQYKWSILLVSGSFFIGSLFLIKQVKQEFVPTQDQNLIILTAQAKPGTSLEETINLIEPLNELLIKTKEISGYFVSVGAGNVFLPIALVDRSQRSVSHTEIMNTLRLKAKEIKNLRISMRDISARNLSTGRLNPIAFNLRGPDLEVLNKLSRQIIKYLEEQNLALDLDSDYKTGLPELTLIPDRQELAKKFVTAESVSQVLNAAIAGLRDGQFITAGRQIDIRYKINEDQIKSVADIKGLFVRNSYGNLIPLEGLVKDEKTNSLNSIARINRQRAVSVFGNLAAGQSQGKVLEATKNFTTKLLPAGYSFHLEGASASFSSSFESLTWVLLLGILVAYMILAIQFNSFIDPVSVLMALPFSFSGAFLILWLSNTSLNLFSFIGLIVLMGIAKKNSIMLVEFTVQLINKENISAQAALLKACPVRLRPILMTSVATLFAALPLIIGSELGIETRRPMGLVIIGGIFVSTLFTLFVVPVFYLILARFKVFVSLRTYYPRL